MNLELNQKGFGKIDIVYTVPHDLRGYLIEPAIPRAAVGRGFHGLMQEFKGEGFSGWYSRYWLGAPAIISAHGDVATLELRIAMRNKIRGTWEKIEDPALPVHYFQMGFVPYVVTQAIFDMPAEFSTFDIHFELKFLRKAGIDYRTLDRFINHVDNNHPAELSRHPHPCSAMMIDAVHSILGNSFSGAGKKVLLKNNVSNILIAALEIVGKDEIKDLPLSKDDIDALHHVRELIEKHCPAYLSNDVLIARAQPNLNAFKLSYGFKRLFGINPYDYYTERRFTIAKQLLRQGDTVSAVAYEIGYESPTTFIRQFKRKFGYTPKHFQMRPD